MNVSTPPPPPPDPMLAQEKQQAQADLVNSMQSQSQGDMASLMARYGSQLALAGAMAGSPMTAPAPPAARV